MARDAAREWLISAIFAVGRDPHRSRQARTDPADLEARVWAKIAESFADAPALQTAAGGIEHPARISRRQNIRSDALKTPDFWAVAAIGNLQPLCNRWATTKPLIYIDMSMLVAELQDFKPPTYARGHAYARTRITRGHGLQLCNRRKNRSVFNGLKVADWLPMGCRCNRLPRPVGSPKSGRQLTGTATGRGQTQSYAQGATRRARVVLQRGPGSR